MRRAMCLTKYGNKVPATTGKYMLTGAPSAELAGLSLIIRDKVRAHRKANDAQWLKAAEAVHIETITRRKRDGTE